MRERLRPSEIPVLPTISAPKEFLARKLLGSFVERITSEVIVTGRENIPLNPPYIVVSNHLGWAGAPILNTIFPHWIYWMTKAETFNHPLIGPVSAQLGMFPVQRGEVDLKAVRTAVQLLKNGQVLGMMPEGTRGRGSDEEGLKVGKKGTILLACLAGVPIVPAPVWGTEEIFPLAEEKDGINLQKIIHFQKPNAFVNIGEIFTEHLKIGTNFLKKEEIENMTTSLMLKLRDLLPPQYHGIYR